MSLESQDNLHVFPEGLTYDDVLMTPCYSEVVPNEVSLTTQLTADIFERPGRLGNMLFMVRETKYVNQFDKIVAYQRSTGISYQPS